MKFRCVHCGQRYALSDVNVHREFTCPSCGERSPIVPVGAGAAPSAAQRATATSLGLQCEKCGKRHRLPAGAVGRQFKCNQCGALSPVLAAPTPGAAPAPAKTVLPSPAATASTTSTTSTARQAPVQASISPAPIETVVSPSVLEKCRQCGQEFWFEAGAMGQQVICQRCRTFAPGPAVVASNDGGLTGGDDLRPASSLSPVSFSPSGVYSIGPPATSVSPPRRPAVASSARRSTGKKKRRNSFSIGDIGDFDNLLSVGHLLLRFVLGPLFIMAGCVVLLITWVSLIAPRPTVQPIGIFRKNSFPLLAPRHIQRHAGNHRGFEPAFGPVAAQVSETRKAMTPITASILLIILFVGLGIAMVVGVLPKDLAILAIKIFVIGIAFMVFTATIDQFLKS